MVGVDDKMASFQHVTEVLYGSQGRSVFAAQIYASVDVC
jgi:hypothetical protein